MAEDEIWKEIPEYPDYQISNFGRVKSLKWGKGQILKPWKNKAGYLKVRLFNDSTQKSFRVHDLLAMAFLGEYKNNTSGFPGVAFFKPNGKYRALIEINGKRKYLGSFETPEGAFIAYMEAFFGEKPKNTSGFPGVSFHKATGKYRARIGIDGKTKSLGLFETPEQAFIAYRDAKLELFWSFFPFATRDDFKVLSARAEAALEGAD